MSPIGSSVLHQYAKAPVGPRLQHGAVTQFRQQTAGFGCVQDLVHTPVESDLGDMPLKSGQRSIVDTEARIRDLVRPARAIVVVATSLEFSLLFVQEVFRPGRQADGITRLLATSGTGCGHVYDFAASNHCGP